MNVQAIIEASTPWVVDENATNYLHTDKEAYCVAISQSTDVPNWPEFETKEYDKTMQDDLNVQWKIEVEGVSQGAYVSQAQHTISVPSRLGLKAQIDGERLIWPPRQLNAMGQRIDSEGSNCLKRPQFSHGRASVPLVHLLNFQTEHQFWMV